MFTYYGLTKTVTEYRSKRFPHIMFWFFCFFRIRNISFPSDVLECECRLPDLVSASLSQPGILRRWSVPLCCFPVLRNQPSVNLRFQAFNDFFADSEDFLHSLDPNSATAKIATTV